MNPELLRKLELASIQRRKVKVPSAGLPAPVDSDVKISATELATAIVGDENLLLIVESNVSPLEAVVKAPPERVLTKKTPMEKTQVTDAISRPEEAWCW